MVEVRFLSVALSVTADNRDNVKGRLAEMYIFCRRMYVGLQQNMLQTVTFVKRFRSLVFMVYFSRVRLTV